MCVSEQDVYTLNFKSYSIRAVAYFLSLFPVCTLRYVEKAMNSTSTESLPPTHTT